MTEKVRKKLVIEWIFYILIFFALLYNLSISWNLFSSRPLSDSLSYPDLARQSHFFYDSGRREPVNIFLVKSFMRLGISDDTSVRLSTVLVVIIGSLLFLIFSVNILVLQRGFVRPNLGKNKRSYENGKQFDRSSAARNDRKKRRPSGCNAFPDSNFRRNSGRHRTRQSDSL